jgi:CHASE3 domain sensor protein
MRITNLIWLSFVLTLILFIVITYSFSRNSTKVKENTERFFKSATILQRSNQLHREVLYMQRDFRSYTVTAKTDSCNRTTLLLMRAHQYSVSFLSLRQITPGKGSSL